MNLSKNVKISQVITPTAGAAATTDINGTTLDMSGFEGVLFILTMGAITSGAVTSAKVQQGAAAGMGDAADLLGTGVTIADDDDEEVFMLDVPKPRERYVRLVIDRGTQNAVVAAAIAIQYGGRKRPHSHGTGVNSELNVSPAEGTA